VASNEDFIKKLEEHGLTKDEIDRKVKETIANMKGWIDEKTALFVIAKELGIEVDQQAKSQSSEQDYSIGQLSDSTQNVNVVGRVVNFSDIRTFLRKDGTQGQFSWFWIFDSKDQIKVVLWDERAKIVKDNAFANDVLVRVLNGQVKRNRDGNYEIHVGSRSDIEISPADVDPSSYKAPNYAKFKVKIGDIHPSSSINKNMITVEGMIERLYTKRTLKKKATDEDFDLQRITIKDDSGEIPVVFWENDTKYLDKVMEGATILLENVSAKPQYNDASKMELSFNTGSRFKVTKKAQAPKQIAINEITTSLSRITVVGEVGIVNDVRLFNKSDGSQGSLQRIQIQDKSGSIAVVFWQEDIKKLEGIDVGYTIKLENIGVQADFRDQTKPELVFKAYSKISVVSDSSSSTIDDTTPIAKLLENEGIYSIEGQITQIGEPLKTITTSDGRTLKLFAVHVSDNTGAIQLTFWEEKAEEFADLTVGENIRVSRVSVKKGRNGSHSASFGKSSELEKDTNFELTELHEVPDFLSRTQTQAAFEFTGNYVSLGSISQEGTYEVKGNISEISRIYVYEACAKCFKNISKDPTLCTCEEGPEKSVYRLIISAILDDGTGTIPITFFGDDAETLINQEAVTIHVKRQGTDYTDFETQIIDDAKMKDLAIIGTVAPNSYSKVDEMKIRKLKIIDLNEDDSIDDLIDEIEK
jgi:replication factor A1